MLNSVLNNLHGLAGAAEDAKAIIDSLGNNLVDVINAKAAAKGRGPILSTGSGLGTILTVVAIGAVGYIVYDKVIKKRG